MKKFILSAISILFFWNISNAQLTDTAFTKKLTVNGYCLCRTTLTNLKNSNLNLKETEVEEMDLAKGCYGTDERFVNGKGYYSDTARGIIFQKERDSDYISKIRLTKEFKGKLPNGVYVDLSNFYLKDLFKLYPEFSDKWESRGCSDYWKFSNDTISFYVKIDKSKKPQFPIEKEFYMNKPIEGIDLTISCSGVRAYDVGYQYSENHPDPVIFIDSIRITKSEFSNFNPDSIASATVIKDSLTLKKFGPDGASGLVYFETKKFAKKHFTRFFSSKSPEYAKIISGSDGDSQIQYILNNKILKENFEADLSLIDDNTFIGIKILTKEQLAKEYGVTDKGLGVIITSKNTKK